MTTHISLGGTCAIAYQLNKHNKRETAYPFDWSKTDITQLITVLEQDFTDYEDVEIKKLSDNHPNNETGFASYILVNRYKITMAHEISDVKEIAEFREKLIRRIDRFKKIEGKIIFYRLETCVYKKNYDDKINKLINILDSYKIDYELRIIVHKSYKESSINLMDNKIKLYYYDEMTPDWKFDNIEWNKIFK